MCKFLNIPLELKEIWKTDDAMVWSHYDCLVVRMCQKAYNETKQSQQLLLAGPRVGSFPAKFCDGSVCGKDCSEKNFEDN